MNIAWQLMLINQIKCTYGEVGVFHLEGQEGLDLSTHLKITNAIETF